MTSKQYKRERRRRGTQKDVARWLGVNRVTVARREAGVLPINQECALALLALPKQEKDR